MIALLQWLGVLGAFSVAFWFAALNIALLVAWARRAEGNVNIKLTHMVLIVAAGALGFAQLVWYGWVA